MGGGVHALFADRPVCGYRGSFPPRRLALGSPGGGEAEPVRGEENGSMTHYAAWTALTLALAVLGWLIGRMG